VPTNVVVQVQFSKQVDPLTVNSVTFFVAPSNFSTVFRIAGTVAVSSDGLTATLTPSALLAPGTSYQIVVNGAITDLEGQLLNSGFGFIANFTTSLSAATAAPTVVMVSPPNGTTGVQVNARVDVVLSAPVSLASVGSNAIKMTAGGTPIAGIIGLSSDRATLTFTPNSLLAVNTSYTINVSGFTDQAGNTVLPFTSSFTTGTSGVADTTAPAVVAVSPANGTTGVAVNSSIVLTFNKNIDPSTVNSGTVAISNNAFNGVFAGNYAVNGAVVTFTPLSPLPGNATVQVAVNNGVVDLAGNVSNFFSSSFTTAAVADTTPPQVVAVTPTNGATGIGRNVTVVLTFSKSLNPNTVNANTIGLLANGTKMTNISFTRSPDNRIVTMSIVGLGVTLPPSSTMAVLATSGVTDLSGNAVANFVSLFTTAGNFDTVSPSVVSQRPVTGASGVPLTSEVVLYVSEAMNAATIPGALHISQNGVLVSGTTQVTDNGQVIQFTPSAPFQNNALIQAFLDGTALDLDGNSLTNYQGSFTTTANTSTVGPSIVDTNPESVSGVPTNAVVNLGFDQTLNPATVNTTTVSLLQGGSTVVPTTVSLVGGGTIVQITPNASLTANTSYSVQLTTGLLGTNGLPDSVDAPGAVLSFTTAAGADTMNPTVTLVSPPNGSVNVGDNANIRVRFSKAINPLSVSGSTITISGGSVTQMPYTVSFISTQEVLIVPYTPLPDATQMTLTISGVTDVAGNAVVAQTTQFTTGTGPDVTIPVVVITNPYS